MWHEYSSEYNWYVLRLSQCFSNKDFKVDFVCTYITEDLLSFGHSAQLRAVAVWVEHGLLFIPVLSIEFLQQQQKNINYYYWNADSANKRMDR